MPRTDYLYRRCKGLRWRQNCFANQLEEDTSATNVGVNLRRMREARNMTIRSLAEISGLSVNTLSLIENGKSSPSVKSLLTLSESLNTPIKSFFNNPKKPERIIYVRNDERPVAFFQNGKLEDLGANTLSNRVEPYVLTLEPYAISEMHDVMHTGYEFAYCLQGRVAYTILNQTYLLDEGDSILFEAQLPHCWQNPNAGISTCLLVLIPMDDHDSPAESHFSIKEQE